MTQVTLNLPNDYHKRAQALAEREGISLDQFMALALAEAVSTLETREFFERRAARGSREKYDAILAKVPHRKPVKGDDPLPMAARANAVKSGGRSRSHFH